MFFDSRSKLSGSQLSSSAAMLQISSAASGEVIATLDAAEFGLLAETRGSTIKVAGFCPGRFRARFGAGTIMLVTLWG